MFLDEVVNFGSFQDHLAFLAASNEPARARERLILPPASTYHAYQCV